METEQKILALTGISSVLVIVAIILTFILIGVTGFDNSSPNWILISILWIAALAPALTGHHLKKNQRQ